MKIRKTLRLFVRLANHLSFDNFTVITKKTKADDDDDGFNGSTDVSCSMTSAYRAYICVCECVCVFRLCQLY